MKVFYRNFEVTGEETLPENQGIILCVNHVNALIDAAVLQASTDKDIRALARDGLFKNPFLKPVLKMIGSVPIYRRETEKSDASKTKILSQDAMNCLLIMKHLLFSPKVKAIQNHLCKT